MIQISSAKRYASRTLIALFGLWPVLHFALVQRYGMDPWKFFGLAMYCEPRLRESAMLYEVSGRWRRPLPQPGEPLNLEIERYMRARRAYGELASNEHVREVADGIQPGIALELTIESWSIDPESKTMVRRYTTQRLTASNTAAP